MLAVLTQWMFVQAYDQHLNMILGEVEEVVTTVEIDDETYEEIVRVRIAYCLPSILYRFTCRLRNLYLHHRFNMFSMLLTSV